MVSISIGATLIGRTDLGESDEDWLGRVDAALYRAKAAGRNRVVLAEWSAGVDEPAGVPAKA